MSFNSARPGPINFSLIMSYWSFFFVSKKEKLFKSTYGFDSTQNNVKVQELHEDLSRET